MSANPSIERYHRRVLIASMVYAVTLLLASWWFRDHRGDGLVAVILALLPALAIVAIFAAIGRYLLEETDEYLRLLMARQVIVASGFALSISTVWGFLASFGVAAPLPAYFVAALWFVGLGLGRLVNVISGRANA